MSHAFHLHIAPQLPCKTEYGIHQFYVAVTATPNLEREINFLRTSWYHGRPFAFELSLLNLAEMHSLHLQNFFHFLLVLFLQREREIHISRTVFFFFNSLGLGLDLWGFFFLKWFGPKTRPTTGAGAASGRSWWRWTMEAGVRPGAAQQGRCSRCCWQSG